MRVSMLSMLLALDSADRLYWIGADSEQGSLALDAIAGFASCFTVRGLALYYGWSLPAYRARPGRVPVDAAPEPEAAAKQRSEPKP